MLHQKSIDVLEHVRETAWGLPGFVRPKKDGTIRTIKDLGELNKCVVREVYPLPRIQDIMQLPQLSILHKDQHIDAIVYLYA
jgi:hypothetical protein